MNTIKNILLKVMLIISYALMFGCFISDNNAAAFQCGQQYPHELKMHVSAILVAGLDYHKKNLILADNAIPLSQKNKKGLIIQLVNEAGKPLHGVVVNVFRLQGTNISFYIKEKPVNEEGQLIVPDDVLPLPQGSQIGIHSKDEIYFHYVRIEDLSVQNGIAKITVPKTGLITATIKKYPRELRHPVVVEVYKENDAGVYVSFRGIGIFLQDGYTFEVPGLPTGIYKIQIKDDYESTEAYFDKEAIRVVNGKSTNLGEIELKK